MNTIKIYFLILSFISLSLANRVITPIFTHKDGSASLSEYNGFSKNLLVNGQGDQTLSWITFQNKDLNIQTVKIAEIWLYLSSVENTGTITVYPITQEIQSLENNVQHSDIVYNKNKAVATLPVETASLEKIYKIDITQLLSARNFYGIVLISNDGATAQFSSKEGTMSPKLYITHEISATASMWHTGEEIPHNLLGKSGDFYLHNKTGDIYTKVNNVWNSTGNIKGKDGIAGVPGPAGKDGPVGKEGLKGSPGTGTTWKGLWDTATVYDSTDVVAHQGNSYIALKRSTGIVPPEAAHWLLIAARGAEGPAGLNGKDGTGTRWQGAWSDAKDYAISDAVTHEGSSYLALKESKNIVPVNGEHWLLIAQRGEKGETGVKGDKGDKGDTGPQGPPGGGASWKEEWINGKNYAVSDAVSYQGNSYYALKASNGVTPGTANDTWLLVAAKGNKGDKGDTGPIGPQGPSGDSYWTSGLSFVKYDQSVSAQSYKYTTPRTHYYSIGCKEFKPSEDAKYSNLSGFYIRDVGIKAFHGNVHLPNGATITKITFYVVDNSSSDIQIHLRRRVLATQAVESLVTFQSTGSTGTTPQALVLSNLSIQIDNSQEGYYFYGDHSWDGSEDILVEGAVIEYTLSEAQ